MRSSWSEPYLWLHLAGAAAVPILLELCLLGLAASESLLPANLAALLVGAVGITPIFWMQWQRPFCIFSLSPLVLKPSELTESQRQLLVQFKAPIGKVVAVIMAVTALVILWQLNRWVPLVGPAAAMVPGRGLGGLLLAMAAFLLSNLFLQVPASVLQVLLTPDRQIAAAEPYPVVQIFRDFTLLGFPVKRILPPIKPATGAKRSEAAASVEPAQQEEAPLPVPPELQQDEWSEPEAQPSENPVSESPAPEAAEPAIETNPVEAPLPVLEDDEPDLEDNEPDQEWEEAEGPVPEGTELAIFELEVPESELFETDGAAAAALSSSLEDNQSEDWTEAEIPAPEVFELEILESEIAAAASDVEPEMTPAPSEPPPELSSSETELPHASLPPQLPNVTDTIVQVGLGEPPVEPPEPTVEPERPTLSDAKDIIIKIIPPEVEGNED